MDSFSKWRVSAFLIRLVTTVCCFFIFLVSANLAFADCKNIGKNSEWNSSIQDLVFEYEAGNYQEALRKAKKLSDTICSDSPMLLYIQGKIYDALGDPIKARLFYQKSSEMTYEYAVAPDMAQKIWNARYESEHPDRTESAVAAIVEKNRVLETQLGSLSHDFDSLSYNNEERLPKIWMWTGIGTGLGGLVLLISGASLVGTHFDDPVEFQYNPATPFNSKHKIRDAYVAGWALTGTGIAFVAAGSVLAGYFGYLYHQNKNKDVSVNISPVGASFSMVF